MKDQKVLFLLLVFSATPSFAYIDPGMGAFIWQSIIAVAVGVVYQVLKVFRLGRKSTASTKPALQTVTKKESHGSDEDELQTAA